MQDMAALLVACLPCLCIMSCMYNVYASLDLTKLLASPAVQCFK